MDYDVLILGGGIVGCAAAYELSKYSLNIALIEKDYDIADDVSLVNSAIIYDGVECDDTLMSKLEIMGSKIIIEQAERLHVPFKNKDFLMIASNEEEENKLEKIYERGLKRGIEKIELLEPKEVYEMEPNLNIKVKKALHSKNTAVICPYDLAIAYGEVAFDNGVKFKLEEEVLDIEKISRGFRVTTNKNKFTCKIVLNTTPGQNYSIDSEMEKPSQNRANLKYFLLEKNFKGNFNSMVSTLETIDGRIYTSPTVQGNTIAAIGSYDNMDNEEAIEKISKLMSGINLEYINSVYYSNYYMDTILIDDSFINKGYIKVTGKHYAQVTITPAIVKMLCETIVNNTNCKLKKDFYEKRREFYRFRDLSNEDRQNIINADKKYGRIVCVCQNITEGEIVDSIRRPLGARTVEGVKRRTGVTLGSCQGSFCINKIVSILARETNKHITEIVKDSKNSNILLSRIKEFDGV